MSETVSKVLSFAILLVQSVSVPSGSYGGLSGHDSVGRAMCTLVDQSVSLLLFYGLVNLCIFPKRGGLARMNIVHTSRPAEDLKRSLVNYRANWLDIGNLAARSGKFKIVWSNGGHPNITDPEGQLPATKVAPNSNHWIYPYMLGQQPHEKNGVHEDGEVVCEVVLTRRTLIRTTALALARFATLIASSILITIIHILVIALFYKDPVIRALIIVGDAGRWLLVNGQLSSIVTYSMEYKGVRTWTSPNVSQARAGHEKRWTMSEQLFCREEILRYLGRSYHARILFLACDYMWPKIARRVPVKLNPDEFWDTTIFSTFSTFDDQCFADPQSTLLKLHVKPRGPGDLSNDFVDAKSYAVTFQVPTLLIQTCFSQRLVPAPSHRFWNFTLLAIPCLCSIAIPYTLVWTDEDAKLPALIILGLLQIPIAVLAYKDIDDWSINCKFQPDTPTTATEQPSAAVYPPSSSLGHGIQHAIRSTF